MHQILITNTAKKSIKKLSFTAKEKARLLLKELETNPQKGLRLRGVFKNYYSLHFKVGKIQYRAIYDIDQVRQEITIYLIATRENFYKKVKNLLS